MNEMSYLERLAEHLRRENDFEKDLEKRGRKKGSKYIIRTIEREGDPRGVTRSVEGRNLRSVFSELVDTGQVGDEIIISEVDNQGRLVETLPKVRKV